jgi:hypothetical protein
MIIGRREVLLGPELFWFWSVEPPSAASLFSGTISAASHHGRSAPMCTILHLMG